jgi:hypothetical protein
VVILVGVSIAFLTYNGGFQPLGDLATTSLNVPLSGAKSADVMLSLGTGDVTLDSSANSESLATGSLEYYQGRSAPQQSVTMVGDQEMLTLRQTGVTGFDLNSLFGSSRSPEWDIHLNPNIPTAFTADVGTGNSTIDLSHSQTDVVNIDGGTGNATITFPVNAGQVTGTVNGGVGNLNLTIPEGLEARISVNTGIGNINVDDTFTKQGDNVYVTKGYSDAKNKLDLKVEAGVGNVEISR